MIFVGVESGSQRVLNLMGKSNSVAANHRFIRWCNELGIQTWCNIILGHPGETEKDMKLTLRFVDRAQPTCVCVSQATPFPGTFLWERNREDVIEATWDAMARHIRLPKFQSMSHLQPQIEDYTFRISRGWSAFSRRTKCRRRRIIRRWAMPSGWPAASARRSAPGFAATAIASRWGRKSRCGRKNSP